MLAINNILSELIVVSLVLVGCGSGGGSGSGDSIPVIPVINTENILFSIDSDYIAEASDNNLAVIGSLLGKGAEPMNAIPNIFNNTVIPVIYRNCESINAFYTPAKRDITLCHELTVDAFSYFLELSDDDGQEAAVVALRNAYSLMNFVMYHEIGHALDDIRGSIGIGGSFESVADAISVVLSIRTGQPRAAVSAAIYFPGNSSGGSFADVHSSSANRAGNILCWTIGSSSRLADIYPSIAADFVEKGRDCVGAYADQLQFVSGLIPSLRDIPPVTSLRASHVNDFNADVLDKMLSELLQRRGVVPSS